MWVASAPLAAKNIVPAFPAEAPYYGNRDIFVRSGRTAAYGTPLVAVTSSGTALVVVNDRLDSPVDNGFEQKVVLRRSLDNGKSWLGEQILGEKKDYTCFPSGLVCDKVTNKVFVFFGVIALRPREKSVPEKSATTIYVIESCDEGVTWSEWRNVTGELQPERGGRHYGTQSGGNAVQKQHSPHQGRLVVSSRSSLGPTDIINFGNAVNCVFYSDDHGATWHPGGHTRGWVGESALVELSDGSLYLSNRNHDPESMGVRSHDISYDGGQTFTEYGLDPELIEPICHAGITRYDRNTVLFSNPKMGLKKVQKGKAPTGFRQNMTVRASFDDCKTWPVEKLIDPSWAGYSAIAVCNDGTILCVYERGTGHTTEIIPSASRQNVAVARFNMAWLMQLERPAEMIAIPVTR
ncbi:MAG: Sialidase precursor [Verrucomicrobiota bacterium]|jgi:sialidase-1